MDSSYWSKPNVVAATRDFVCIRLATYEDKKEVEFLNKIYRSRSGQLENTVFALLAADGQTKLSRSGRSPDFAFRGERNFIAGLNEIAKAKSNSQKRFSDATLPVTKNLDLGLNIASSDLIQLIVVVGEDEQVVQRLSQKALPLAWNEKIGGQFVFATAKTASELKPIGLDQAKNGIYVVEPGPFGMSGKVVAKFDESIDIKKATEKLAALSGAYKVSKDYQQHVRAGISLGIEWKTETPVTDQQSLRANRRGNERARGR